MVSNKLVDLRKKANIVRSKCYTEDILKNNGKKSNLKKILFRIKIVHRLLILKEKRRIIFENDRKRVIIHDIHEGLGENPKAKALATHRGHK